MRGRGGVHAAHVTIEWGASSPRHERDARKPLRGDERIARVWTAFSRRFVREPIEIDLNGRLGLVLPSDDGHRAAVSFVVTGGRITRIDSIRNPEKLRRL